MKINDFFEIGSKLISSTFQAAPIELTKDKNGIDNHDNLIKGRYDNINFPVIFKQNTGKKLMDVLDTGFVNLFLISDKMKKILEDNHLTGWKTYPIKLYDKKDNEIFGYHGFSVTGCCGPIDDAKAEIINKQRVPTGPIFQVYKGLHIGIDKWDGMDFFIPEKSGFFIIPKKVAEILTKEKITNIRLENLENIEITV